MTQDNNDSWEGQDIYIGLDVHVRSWKVAILTESVSWKIFSQDPDPDLLVRYLNKHFPDAHYQCVYEAGYCGFWIQRALSGLGVDTIVINPADVPTTDKERVKKTDRRSGPHNSDSPLGGFCCGDHAAVAAIWCS